MDAIDEARRAVERRAWGEAHRQFSAHSARHQLSIDDLDRFATTAFLSGNDEQSFELWAEAHRRCIEHGAVARAASFGIQAALGLGFTGDVPRMQGWVDRTKRILEAADLECVERGYLDHALAMCRILVDGDVEDAHERFRQAATIGARYGDRNLVTLAQIGEGRCKIYLGELGAGVALLDEAMVAVETGELSPLVVGDAYCTVIDAVHELFDVTRCETWTSSFARWCDSQPDLVLYRGHCLLHRAEVLQLRGDWTQALAAAQEACERLAEPVQPRTLGGACYVEAELHRLRGRFADAEQGYRRANDHGCEPQPGLSLLRLAQGRLDAADASIRRVVAETEGPIGRARVLAPYVEIILASGDVDAAGAGAAELDTIAETLGSPFLRAQAAHARGAVQLAARDPESALLPLRRAWRDWSELGARYDGARTRLLLASACRALGDADGAELEQGAARSTLVELGAAHDLGGSTPSAPPAGLTDREVEVLELLAAGMTNRAIGAQLFISERTVASHVAHIFTKLGIGSRTAATAFAYEHGLVDPSRHGTG